MRVIRAALLVSAASIASLLTIVPVDAASASQLIVSSDSVVYPNPAVTASIHLTSPSVVNYPSVYVSPQYLNGTLEGNNVQLFAYCVDILSYSGPGTFDVVPLLSYLGGDTNKYNIIAGLIAAAGGPGNYTADAATQAAVWEAIYDSNPYDVGVVASNEGNFWINNVNGDSHLLTDANALLANAVTNAGHAPSNLQLFVARNANQQDMLFWSAVPEPSTWTMMLLGFAGVGLAIRRKPKTQMTVR